jgi:molecular chaperone IbpA
VYKLELAVAGFKISELDINITNDRILSVKGRKNDEQVERNWIHRGIAARDFERQFTLAEHIKVISAKLEDGLLIIDLLREVPEPAKGINIPITTSNVVDVNVDPDQV